MARRINGKDEKEFLKEFFSPLPSDRVKKREDGYYYFPYDVYEERLLDSVGFFYFEVKCGEPRMDMIMEKPMVVKSGSLILYDDDGKEVKRVTIGAGEALVLSKRDNSVVNFSNTQKKLDRDILINAMQALGVGRKQLNGLNKNAGNVKKMGLGKQENVYEIKFLKRIIPMSRGYKSEVEVSGKSYELVIWQDGVEKIEKRIKMSEFCQMALPSAKLKIKGYYSNYQDKVQLVMTSIA